MPWADIDSLNLQAAVRAAQPHHVEVVHGARGVWPLALEEALAARGRYHRMVALEDARRVVRW